MNGELSPVPTPLEWSRAFARQARADLGSFRARCIAPAFPTCHRLLFLQVACEKLAKSYLCAGGADPLRVQASHAYTAKVLPILIRQEIARFGPASERRLAWLAQAARPLLREVELLSPSVDDGGTRPANCEYPWVDASGTVRVPATETFPNLSPLAGPMGRELLKIVERATDRLASA